MLITNQLPHSLRRAYRNDGSPVPVTLPAEFRTYTRLVEWSPEHQLIDAYVLNDDDTVLFTFEGETDNSTTYTLPVRNS